MVAPTVHKLADPNIVPGTDLPGGDIGNRTYGLLGGDRAIGRVMHNLIDAHDMIMEGFPSKTLVHLVDAVAVLGHGDALNKAIGISLRTLQRKKKNEKADDRLSPEQSSRAWRFAEILARATDTLGSQKAAEAWMLVPAMALDNRRPIDLLSSAAGAEAVEDHLARLEYGVYT